jgi:hypothetical protein
MDANDNAGYLNDRVVQRFFVGSPPGASPFPQEMCDFHKQKKEPQKLFDGEEVEPLRLKMRMKQAVSLVGVQCTHHLRSGLLSNQATA